MNAICGPAIVAQEREPERTSWCFRCRHVTDHYRVVSYPERGSYYEPSVDVRCGEYGIEDLTSRPLRDAQDEITRLENLVNYLRRENRRLENTLARRDDMETP